MEFKLLGDETNIVIKVIGRQHPDATDYWDGNWIFSIINIEIPGYSVEFPASLRTDEIFSFMEELKNLDETLKGKASFKNMEDFIVLEAEVDLTGKVMWTGETCYPLGTGAVLKFDFESDQSYLKYIIKELKAILEEIPVIGKP
ncbi:hypothetical protein [Bacillus sp. Cs-700]|uniref:WapI family immunity protein n=1 Tax=Bacillus sp. Cs-700 TaxID=2589818 RepID=UPI001408EA27|nr:hypothetical protein [Bacillus sp. Cs-700]